jgi:hypothetical protein
VKKYQPARRGITRYGQGILFTEQELGGTKVNVHEECTMYSIWKYQREFH